MEQNVDLEFLKQPRPAMELSRSNTKRMFESALLQTEKYCAEKYPSAEVILSQAIGLLGGSCLVRLGYSMHLEYLNKTGVEFLKFLFIYFKKLNFTHTDIPFLSSIQYCYDPFAMDIDVKACKYLIKEYE